MADVNDRNHPIPATCPHCGNDYAKLLPLRGDRSDYRCPNCGEFSISGTREHLFETGQDDPKKARFVEEGGRRWLKPVGASAPLGGP